MPDLKPNPASKLADSACPALLNIKIRKQATALSALALTCLLKWSVEQMGCSWVKSNLLRFAEVPLGQMELAVHWELNGAQSLFQSS